MEGDDMTIQPGMRIEAKAQHRAATLHRVMPSARGKYAPPRFPSDLVGIERWQRWLDAVAMHEVCIVRAPTGYGKTAFAASLLQPTPRGMFDQSSGFGGRGSAAAGVH
jgi:LuxR family maltose regulon positive regulatory protein